MNNYDFNYNGDMIEKKYKKNRLILHLVGLKWMNFLLIGFTIFQNLFFYGFSVISFFISIYIFYLSYMFILVAKNDPLIVEFEYNDIVTRALSLNFHLHILILLSIIDAMFNFLVNKLFLVELLYSEDLYQKNYGLFIAFIFLFRIIYLTLMRMYNRLEVEFQFQN